MNKQISCSHVIAIILGIVFVTFFTYDNAYAARFVPIPFNNIPSAIIKSEDKDYEFTSDYSVDFGGETRIEHEEDAVLASIMKLDKDDDSLSIDVECESNDICDDSLSRQDVRVYLVDRGIQDGHIARNSIPVLELERNDCGSQSIVNCANFDFDIPEDILTKKYKIVVDMAFDEAEWIFINPVRILN